MDWYSISFIVFMIVVATMIFKNRKKVTVKYYVFYRYDTKRGKKLIDRIAKLSPRFWKAFGSIGVFVGIIAMILGFDMITKSFIKYIISPKSFVPSISIVIPVPFENLTYAPGILGVPFWYWIISVAILIFFHEGMHGILARAEKIRIKTLGLILLAVIPGAFVEPDEKQLKKANWKAKLRIYSAGSFINILIGIIFMIFLLYSYLPNFYEDSLGFSYYTVGENHTKLPAQLNNLTGALYSINGVRIRSVHDLAVFMNSTKPGDTLKIETVQGDLVAPFMSSVVIKNPDFKEYEIKTVEVGNRSVIGVTGFIDVKVSKYPGFINFLTGLLIWISILNIGVGIVNMLPMKPLDGGLVVETLGERFFPKYKNALVKGLSLLVLFLLLANIFVAFL